MDISDNEQPRRARKKGRQLAFMGEEMDEGEQGEMLDVEPIRKDGLDEELPMRKDPIPDAEMQGDREIEEMRKKKKKTKKGKGKEVRVEEGTIQGRDDAIEGIKMLEERESNVQPQIRADEEGNELQVVEKGVQQEDDAVDKIRANEEGNELQVVEKGVQQEDDAADKAMMEVDEEANK